MLRNQVVYSVISFSKTPSRTSTSSNSSSLYAWLLLFVSFCATVMRRIGSTMQSKLRTLARHRYMMSGTYVHNKIPQLALP